MTIHVHHLTHAPVVTETTTRCAAAGTIGCVAKKLAALSASFSAILRQKPAARRRLGNRRRAAGRERYLTRSRR
jgi:hypothetical protein